MNVKDAIAQAKAYLADVYDGERIKNVGLEEITYDDSGNAWDITLGFSRPWEQDALGQILPSYATKLPQRSYKVVRVDDTSGKIISIRHRDVQAAN